MGGSKVQWPGEEMPELINFDPKLLEAWLKVPADQPLDIAIPRVAIDMLFDSIHRSLQASIDLLTAVQDLATGKAYDVEEFNRRTAPNIVIGMNSIRHFAMIAMVQKTGLCLDENLKVIDGAGDGD